MATTVRIPQITSVETAVRLYYERIELSNRDIKELFGSLGTARICALKKKAQAEMVERKTPVWNAVNVNTEVAYISWGLDITDLEKRLKRLEAMKTRKEA